VKIYLICLTTKRLDAVQYTGPLGHQNVVSCRKNCNRRDAEASMY